MAFFFLSQCSHKACLEKGFSLYIYSRHSFPWNVQNEKKLQSVNPEFTGLWGSESCGDDKLEGAADVTAPFRIWIRGTNKGMAVPSPLNGGTDRYTGCALGRVFALWTQGMEGQVDRKAVGVEILRGTIA